MGEHTDTRCSNTHGDPVDSLHYVTVYELAVCPGCGSPFLFMGEYAEVPGDFSRFLGERLLYPVGNTVPGRGVPESVARVHHEAVRCYESELYESCVVMCRKCIEAVCHELGVAKGTLQGRLQALKKQQQIDGKLILWADELRITGNIAAHDLDAQIDKSDAEDALHFVKAVIMYVFSLSKRYEEFKRRRASKTK